MDEKIKVKYKKWKPIFGCWETLRTLKSHNRTYKINTYEIWCQGKVAKYEKVRW